MSAGGIPIGESVRIHKVMTDDVLDSGFKQSIVSEVNDTVSNKKTPELDAVGGRGSRVEVVVVDSESKIWDVFACIRFTGDPKRVGPIFRVADEEVLDCFEVIIHC